MKTRRKFLVGVVLVVIVLIIASYGIKKVTSSKNSAVAADSSKQDSTRTADKKGKEDGKTEKKIDPIPIEVATAQLRSISSYYHTTATLQPEKKVNILAKIGGETKKLHVEEGMRVSRGDLLVELDDEEHQIGLDEARINMEKQEQEFRRLEAMFDQKLVSDKEYSDVKYQYELAKNAYDAARLRYTYTKVRAPFDGVITKRFIDVGQNVIVGTQLFELADIDPLQVHMYLPESEVTTIRVGQTIYLQSDSDASVRLEGTVVRISPEVDDRTGTVKVTAETRGQGMPGSFVRIKITTDTHDRSLAIPRRGLVPDAGELFVFVAEADSARKAAVEVGYQDEEYAEVLKGLEVGDSVVVIGQGGLRDGTKVKILTGEENSAPKTETVQVTDSISDS